MRQELHLSFTVERNDFRDAKVLINGVDISAAVMEMAFLADPSGPPAVYLKLAPHRLTVDAPAFLINEDEIKKPEGRE